MKKRFFIQIQQKTGFAQKKEYNGYKLKDEIEKIIVW